MRRALIGSLITVLAAFGLGPAPAGAAFPCTGDGTTAHEIPANPFEISGRFGLPRETPTHLVAFAHGYGHTSESWVQHIERTIDRGAIAFAADYRGTWVDDDGSVRGWFVAEGAQDTIDLARAFLLACPSLQSVILYGVSMGGNASGLAVAAGATRPDGSPLFDHWVAGEPAANVIETYLEASAVAPAVPFAAKARDDIEAQHGGTPWERPSSYASGTVVLRANDIAASGIKGVAIVHGFDDGLVPYNQARELWAALRATGVPTDFYNAARRGPEEDPDENTTLTENVLGPTGMWDEPLAGHGTESSQTHIVIQTGLEIVFRLIAGDADAVPADREFVVDGEAGTIRVP